MKARHKYNCTSSGYHQELDFYSLACVSSQIPTRFVNRQLVLSKVSWTDDTVHYLTQIGLDHRARLHGFLDR